MISKDEIDKYFKKLLRYSKLKIKTYNPDLEQLLLSTLHQRIRTDSKNFDLLIKNLGSHLKVSIDDFVYILNKLKFNFATVEYFKYQNFYLNINMFSEDS